MIVATAIEAFFLREELSEWSQRTFGTDAERGPVGPLKHLAKEAIEAADAYPDRARFLEELADCQLLLWDALRRGRVSDAEHLAACRAKLAVVKRRAYPKPEADGVSEHVRDRREIE